MVATTTISATAKMLLVCFAIARLVSTNTLPENTSATLSKLTFHVITPCMLCTRLAATLGTTSTLPPAALFLLPLAMAVQIALGYGLAWLGVRYSARHRGWHPQHQPTQSASVIASTTAAALGVQQASSALLLPGAEQSRPLFEERVALTASTFGNSLTLPLVFFSTLFSGSLLDAAIACTALVQIAWYPLLWSVGYQAMVITTQKSVSTTQVGGVLTTRVAVANRVGVRMVGGSETPKKPPASAYVQLMRAYNTCIQPYINPPLVGIAAGVLLGASGAWTWLRSTATQPLPMEVGVVAALARWILDVVELLGSGALACQAIVLGASLSTGVLFTKVGMPLVVVGVVRLVVLPMLVLGLLLCCVPPQTVTEGARMAAFVLCVQAAMPPAQSLSIMAQLAGGKDGSIASQTSQLLLQVYALSIVPLTVWVGVFMRVWLV